MLNPDVVQAGTIRSANPFRPMLWLVGIIAVAILSHTAPFPFLLDITDRTVWRMPASDSPTVYLTFDDGPMLWFNWFRRETAEALVPRFVARASPGDIVVIHDGHHKDPRADRRYAIETVDRLIPKLKARGFQFGRICPQ